MNEQFTKEEIQMDGKLTFEMHVPFDSVILLLEICLAHARGQRKMDTNVY